jgi:hypothetical protein
MAAWNGLPFERLFCGARGQAKRDPAFLFTEALGNSEAAGITLRQKRRRAHVPSCRRSPYRNETCPRQPVGQFGVSQWYCDMTISLTDPVSASRSIFAWGEHPIAPASFLSQSRFLSM